MYMCVRDTGLPRIKQPWRSHFSFGFKVNKTDTAWLIIYYLLINHQNHHSVQTKFSIQEREKAFVGG